MALNARSERGGDVDAVLDAAGGEPQGGDASRGPVAAMRKWIGRTRDVLARPLFGRDLFISYSRRDATAYVTELAKEIRKQRPEVSISIDQWAAAPHDTTHPNLLREARRSSLFVVVASTNAVTSKNVAGEIEEYLATGRYLLAIDVDKNLGKGDVWSDVAKRRLASTSPAEESGIALDPKSPVPSPRVVTRIAEAIKFETQTQRIRRLARWTAAGALALVAVATGFSMWRIGSANAISEAALANARIAGHRTARARDAAKVANAQAAAAEIRERMADDRADRADDLAMKAEGRANEAGELATAAEGRATIATAAAEREQEVGAALRLANESSTLLRQQPHLTERAAELAVESMTRLERRGVRALSADIALRESVSLLPRVERDDQVAGTMGQEALSPDGRLYAVTDDESIALYDTATGEKFRLRVEGHAPGRGWGTVAFSADSSFVAASVYVSEESRTWVHVWDTQTRVPGGRVFFAGNYVDKLSLGNRGEVVAAVVGDSFVIHDVKSGAELARRSAGEDLRSIALSADGNFVVGAGEKKVLVWTWRTTDAPREMPVTGGPQFADFSPDGRNVVTVGDGGMSICEWPSAKRLWVADLPPPYSNLRFSGDSRLIAVSSSLAGSGSRVYQVTTGQTLTTLPTRADRLAFNDGASLIATGSFHTARLWRTADGRELGRVAHPLSIPLVGFRPDGRVVSVVKGQRLKVWQPTDLLPIKGTIESAGDPDAIAFDPMTDELAVSTSSMFGSDAKLYRVHPDRSAQECRPLTSTHKAMVFTSAGRLIGGARTGEVRIWERWCEAADAGKVIARLPGAITALALSRDGMMLAMGGSLVRVGRRPANAVVRIIVDWEGRATTVDLPHAELVSSIAFLPDGDVVTGGHDGIVRVWRWRERTDAPVRQFRHGPIVLSLSVDRSGRFVASGGHAVNAYVWDREKKTDAPIAVVPHDTAAWSVEFDPTGQFLATASSDGMAHVWEGWEEGAPRDVVRVELGRGVVFAAFSGDGRLLASLTNGHRPSVSITPWRQKEMIAAGKAALTAARPHP